MTKSVNNNYIDLAKAKLKAKLPLIFFIIYFKQ